MLRFEDPAARVLIGGYLVLATASATALTGAGVKKWQKRADDWAHRYRSPWAHNPLVIIGLWLLAVCIMHVLLIPAILFAGYCLVRFICGDERVWWVQFRPRAEIVPTFERKEREACLQAKLDRLAERIRRRRQESWTDDMEASAMTLNFAPTYYLEPRPKGLYTIYEQDESDGQEQPQDQHQQAAADAAVSDFRHPAPAMLRCIAVE